MSSPGPVMEILNNSFLLSLFLFLPVSAMLIQPVLAEARGSPCREAWTGWSTEEQSWCL